MSKRDQIKLGDHPSKIIKVLHTALRHYKIARFLKYPTLGILPIFMHTGLGLCHYFKTVHNLQQDFMDQYLFHFKPVENPVNAGYWFPQGDHTQRIRLLEAAIIHHTANYFMNKLVHESLTKQNSSI